MSRTTFYSQNYIGWPPVHINDVANPDSDYWHEQAEINFSKLAGALGDNYAKWLEIVWPVIRYRTWSAIAHMAKNTLADHAAGKDVVELAHSQFQDNKDPR